MFNFILKNLILASTVVSLPSNQQLRDDERQAAIEKTIVEKAIEEDV